jgi:fluoroacetyl-CoA thioesterase
VEVKVDAVREEETPVTDENAIDFLGMPAARVLSTPQMIGRMEQTCRNLVLPMLDPGYDTVGTHVDVRHLAAAPMGARVKFRAKLTSIDDRRVGFAVEAWNGSEKIGDGTHERTIINVARFAEKMKSKTR